MRVKENNLRVYKCDLCKRTYSEFDDKTHSRVSVYIGKFTDEFDCCPICTKAIGEVMSALENNKDYTIYVTEEKKQE